MIYNSDYAELRSFGEALRRKRLSKHLSQKALGQKVGIAPNTISQYEVNGTNIALLTALNLIDALDWSLGEWQEEADTIYADNSWRRVARRGKREHADDYNS